METKDFSWPRALQPLMAAAESDNLASREMYPTEVAALIALVAGAPLSEKPRLIAPETSVAERSEENPQDVARQQEQHRQGFASSPVRRRKAYLFSRRLPGGKTIQMTLYTDYEYLDLNPRGLHLSQSNIVLALVRVVTKARLGAVS